MAMFVKFEKKNITYGYPWYFIDIDDKYLEIDNHDIWQTLFFHQTSIENHENPSRDGLNGELLNPGVS